MAIDPNERTADLMEVSQAPTGCVGLYTAHFEVSDLNNFQDRTDFGRFNWRAHLHENAWPKVHMVHAWRSGPPVSAIDSVNIQFGFVRMGGSGIVDQSFRLFDSAEVEAQGGPVFQDAYVEYKQAVPQTDGQPWEFFVTSDRGSDTQRTITCEVTWSMQPTIRFNNG